jgi:hypothetical protein
VAESRRVWQSRIDSMAEGHFLWTLLATIKIDLDDVSRQFFNVSGAFKTISVPKIHLGCIYSCFFPIQLGKYMGAKVGLLSNRCGKLPKKVFHGCFKFSAVFKLDIPGGIRAGDAVCEG